MNTNAQLQGLAWGSLFPLSIMALLFIRALTKNESATIQRANRQALLIGLLLSGLLVGLFGYLYTHIDPILASYLAFPVGTVVIAILFVLVPKLSRAFAQPAKTEAEPLSPVHRPIQIDPEIRQHQETLRSQLAALPQFRETVDGDLLSLLTGDRVYWGKYTGESCLIIEFSNRCAIAACRWETLVRYVRIQTRIGHYLEATIDLAIPPLSAGGAA